MNNVTKEDVINYIKHDRTLIKARYLYDNLPNKNLSINNYLARIPDNFNSVRIACYELCKLFGISERQMNILLNQPVIPQRVLPLYKNPPLPPKKQEGKKETEFKKNKEKSYTSKPSIKIREQFPFLSDKDCPRALHLIVADLISAYERFTNNQPKLHEKGTQKEMETNVNEVLKDYILRKECFEELEYYKEKQVLLGKHPVFHQLKEEEKILKMNALKLTNKLKNLKGNKNRNLKKAENAENETKRLKSLALVERDQKLIELVESELKNRN